MEEGEKTLNKKIKKMVSVLLAFVSRFHRKIYCVF